MKNAKVICFCLALLFAAFVLPGCRTAKTDNADIIAGNSHAAGRLEATVEGLDRAVDSSRRRIGDVIEAGRGIENGIDRLEYLFDSYEREVELLQREIERIRKEAEDEG